MSLSFFERIACPLSLLRRNLRSSRPSSFIHGRCSFFFCSALSAGACTQQSMVAAETSASPITVASRKLHSPTSRASTKQRLNWLRQSNSCATRFALAASADERRVEFFSMDHPEQVRLCLRVRLPARQAFRFCPSPDRVSRKNL